MTAAIEDIGRRDAVRRPVVIAWTIFGASVVTARAVEEAADRMRNLLEATIPEFD